MTFKEIQDAVIAARFNEGLRSNVKLWINMREQMIWSAADWPFKKMPRTSMTVDASTGVVSTGSAVVRRVRYMETAGGDSVRFLEPEEFWQTYPVADANTAAAPDHFTVDGGVIYVAPVGATSIYAAYEKRLVHYNNSAVEVAGPMTADTDYPVWDSVYHYYLVLGAIATGIKRENDPTFQPLEDEFGAGMIVMREELLPPDAPENRQYGRQPDWE